MAGVDKPNIYAPRKPRQYARAISTALRAKALPERPDEPEAGRVDCRVDASIPSPYCAGLPATDWPIRTP